MWLDAMILVFWMLNFNTLQSLWQRAVLWLGSSCPQPSGGQQCHKCWNNWGSLPASMEGRDSKVDGGREREVSYLLFPYLGQETTSFCLLPLWPFKWSHCLQSSLLVISPLHLLQTYALSSSWLCTQRMTTMDYGQHLEVPFPLVPIQFCPLRAPAVRKWKERHAVYFSPCSLLILWL